MSWEATAYVNSLKECCDGAEMAVGQKLLLFCLADHHNRSTRRCDPSLELLADESLQSLASVKRHLDYLERHCVIERRHPHGTGRGKYVTFVFLMLDDPERLTVKLKRLSEVAQIEPLFYHPGSSSEGAQIRAGSSSEGAQIDHRNKEEPKNQKEPKEPITPNGAINEPPGDESGAAEPGAREFDRPLRAWLAVKQELEAQLPAEEVKLWVKPARLQRVMAGCHMLIALPPSNKIIRAAYARRELLHGLLVQHKYHFSFAKYADDYDKAEAKSRYGIEVQTYGTKKAGVAAAVEGPCASRGP